MIAALLLVAPTGLAQADAVGQAGGQAVAQAESSYHADGSGALDAANDEQQSAREDAANTLRDSGNAYQDAYAEANASTNADVDRPECETCRDAIANAQQQGSGSLDTAHEAEKAADVDNEYVDAGADAQASGEAQAWYEQLFTGVADAYDKVHSLLDQDADVNEEAHAQAEQSMDTENQLREKAATTLEEDQQVNAPVEPSTEGSVGGEHAASAATETVTEASAP